MGQLRSAGILVILLCGMLPAAFAPAAAELQFFAAGPEQISSVGVLDIAQDPGGNIYFGTDNGLSFYDGTWHITHWSYGQRDTGLLSDHILALEYDSGGNLWIGYPNGLQRLESGSFVTFRDQQLLKSLDIHELVRRNREMWVAAGNAGVHRYVDGEWLWFQPGGPGGLGCNFVSTMATDPATGTLFVACREGIWSTDGDGPSPSFSRLVNPGLVPDPVRGIVGDPFGGVYILNATSVVHVSPAGGWEITVTAADLMPGIMINDLRIDSGGTLWIATDNGIYAWKDGRETGHLDTTTGLRHNGVKRLFLDGSDRLWFVTPENVGFYRIEKPRAEGGSIIPVTTFELPAMTPRDTSPVPVSQITPDISVQGYPEETPAPQTGALTGLLDSILAFFRGLFTR